MNYQCAIDIDLPRNQVIALFDNTDNLFKWQRGLRAFEPVSGELGQEGAKSRMKFRIGKREFELIETITKLDLPTLWCGTYETKGVLSVVENHFDEIGSNATRWVSNNEFRLRGWMRLLGLFPGMFCKQTMACMQDFKNYAENGVDVNA